MLDQFCERMLRQFLLDTVLLPRLSPDPSHFPEPRPTPDRLRKDLASAFESHAGPSIRYLTTHIRHLLGPGQKAQLERLCKERKVMLLLDDNAREVDALHGLKQDFMDDAVDTLGHRLRDPAYALFCLLEVYFSYPGKIHQDLLALEENGVDRTDPCFESKQAEFQIQHRRWKKDLNYLLIHRSAIDQLGDHGKEYFLRKLQLMSQAAYRPSLRTLTLRSALATACSQTEVIAEEVEPAQ